MEKQYYKVVKEKNISGKINYLSAMSFLLPNDIILTYEIGKTTKPTIGKIFIFKTLEDAINFAYKNYTDIGYPSILKGTAKNIGKITRIIPRHADDKFPYDWIISFWNFKNNHKKPTITVHTPENSFSCSEFTSTELIHNWR